MKVFGKRSALVYILIASAFIIGLLVLLRPRVETRPVEIPLKKIEVLEVKKGPTQMILNSQGTVTPGIQSSLVAQVAGRIVSKSGSFEAGGYFRNGESLLSIEASDYRLAVTQAKSQVAQAELAFQLEQEQAKIARDEWQALNSDPIPPLAAREPQLNQARAALEAAKANLEKANLDFSRTSVRAPFTGRVRATHTDVGQFVSPGTPLGTIYSIDKAEIRLPVSDNALAFISLPPDGFRRSSFKGPDVILKATFAGEMNEWRGHITRMEGEIDARSRMIYLVAEVSDPFNTAAAPDRAPLMPGLFVEAEILGNSLKEMVEIPRAALRNNTQVLVVDGESKIRFRNVEVVRESGDIAYIGNGIKDGERICTTPLNIVTEGMLVEVVESEKIATREVSNE